VQLIMEQNHEALVDPNPCAPIISFWDLSAFESTVSIYLQ
jgi:hypothetical protein